MDEEEKDSEKGEGLEFGGTVEKIEVGAGAAACEVKVRAGCID